MLLIIEKQPVQYRAPLYAEIHRMQGEAIRVMYQSSGATDQRLDPEFGNAFAWDIPLLEGYSHEVVPHRRLLWKSLWRAISERNVDAVLLTDFSSAISIRAMLLALLNGTPLWLRMETQDHAYARSIWKTSLRNLCYQLLYAPISRALAIGQLNREHYQRHGLHAQQLHRVPYVVANPLQNESRPHRQQRREQLRDALGISQDKRVVAFFGKLIPKKNPDILVEAFRQLPADLKPLTHLLFVGSGALESALRSQCQSYGIPATFAGFINQRAIHDYYLASDVVCLPSRQMGETWGLTVNEGLQAGCAVLCSEHVGCSVEFATWERVRVCRSEDAGHAAQCLNELLRMEPDPDWCARRMAEQYSMQSAARDWVLAMQMHASHSVSRSQLAV